MPYHSRPISEAEIDALPLRFVKLERGEEELFTDVLLRVWFSLAQSGSLAALPPVPDVVSFVDDCAIFYLIFHTDPKELKLAPGDRLTSAPPSPPPKVASPSKAPRSSPNRRPHPYANARPQASSLSNEDSFKASSSTAPDPSLEDSLSDEVIGCVYLSHSSSTQNSIDIGIALRPEARGRGFGRATITKFVRFSFETLQVHRVVANVFGPSEIHQQQSARESGAVRWIFEKIGFVPEGVQRRAAFSAAEGVWRDVYPLAMLDVDWVRLCGRGTGGRASIASPFDAMMERHNSEREEMSEWMDDPGWGTLRRVSSTETIKAQDDTPAPELEEPTPEPTPEQEPERSPSPIHSESSFSIPSEHDWRSATPSSNSDLYSLVSHSPPPESIASDNFSAFSLSNASSPQFVAAASDEEPSLVDEADLEPPLSPGFSSTGDEVIELASLPNLARHLADATHTLVANSPPFHAANSPPLHAANSPPSQIAGSSSSHSGAGSPPTQVASSSNISGSPPSPYIVGPTPTTPRRQTGHSSRDESLSEWSTDSDFDSLEWE